MPSVLTFWQRLFEKHLLSAAIEKLVRLAVLMSIVASIGGNAGTQNVAVAVRAIGVRQVDVVLTRNFMFREVVVALLNGFVVACLAGLVFYVWL